MNINETELQLKKRIIYPYRWHRKQNDQIDRLTNFIYKIENFDQLLEHIRIEFPDNREVFDYALNRWYNYWSAMAVEYIFSMSSKVTPARNYRDRLVDFEINEVKFDHKTSVFPEKYPHGLAYAVNDPKSLIVWLYRNQSQEQRMHLKNRLFIVLHSKHGPHWKLKAEISWIEEVVNDYLEDFSVSRLYQLNLESQSVTLSDIIWGIK